MSFARTGAGIALATLFSIMPASGGATQTYIVQQVGHGPAKGYDDIHISKAAAPGQKVRIWWATSLNPDCSVAGTMATQILSPPANGHAEISDDPLYPNYLPPNPRTVCNASRVPGKQAFYTSSEGFRGHDKVILRNATSEGRMRRIIVDVDVR